MTIRAVNNNTDAPDKTVTVSAMVSNTIGATTPADKMLTITDDDAAPRVTLALSSTTTSEDDGTAIGVTASLSRPSSRDTTVSDLCRRSEPRDDRGLHTERTTGTSPSPRGRRPAPER